jgi:hypothetical protein
MINKQRLTESEIETFQEAQKHSKKAHFWKRCLAVELRFHRNKSVSYIVDLLQV